MDELVARRWERGETPNFLHGAYPLGGGTALDGALTSAYREHLGAEGLEEALSRALQGSPVLVPAFAALLRGDAAPEGAQALTEEALRTVFVRVLQALAAERPTILLVDDLHRAGDESLALFAALAQATADHRVLLVGTCEPGALTTWRAGLARLEHVDEMALKRLDAAAVAALLTEAAGSDRLAHELATGIASKTDGNPYFLFEMLRSLREEGTLTRRADGTWTLAGMLDDLRFPSSIASLLQARIAHLDADERGLLEVAACQGVEFDPLVTGRVLELETLPTLRRFARIERETRLVRSAGRSMVFDHPSVRDALRDGLSESLREVYHGLIAELLAAQTGPAEPGTTVPTGARVEEIFEHALRGRRADLARRTLTEAIRSLEAAHLRGRACDLIERCLAWPALLDPTQRILLLLRGQAVTGHLGRSHRRAEMVQEALSLAQANADPRLEAEARGALGLVQWSAGRLEDARAELLDAVELARSIGDEGRAALCTSHLGLVLHDLGRDEEAEAHHRAYLRYAEENGITDGRSSTSTNLGLIAFSHRDYARARTLYEASLALATECGNRTWEANAANNLAGVHFTLGQWDEARRYVERNVRISRAIGHREGEAVAQGSLGLLAFSEGRLADALAHQQDAIGLFRELAAARNEALAQGNLGQVLRTLGRVRAALDACDRQEALATLAGDPRNAAGALLNRGRALLDLGSPEAATEVLGQALRRYGELGRRREIAHCHLELGRAAQDRGAQDVAAHHLHEAIRIAEELGLVNVRVLSSLRLALVDGPDTDLDAAVEASEFAQLERVEQLEVRWLQFRVTRDETRLEEARRILRGLRDHAPSQDRDAMTQRVALYRQVREGTDVG